jgi:hypothetical protein
VRTETLRNDGPAPVTASVSFAITGPSGEAPPAGMFTASPSQLTLQAGGTGQVTVTATTGTAANATNVSLRAVAVDGAGNAVDQTIIRPTTSGEGARAAGLVVRRTRQPSRVDTWPRDQLAGCVG